MNVNTTEKSWETTLLLAIFLGHFGVHRFYTGKIATGILYLFTMGVFGFGYLVDLILIVSGMFRDKDGFVIKRKTNNNQQQDITYQNQFSSNNNTLFPSEIKTKIIRANKANPYVDITPYELGFSFPIVSYTGFHPSTDEILIYAAPASTFKDKEQVMGYTGTSAGVSFRVTKGVSVRTGGSNSRAIRNTVRQSNIGDLLITNKRIMFVCKDDSFEFQINKISTVKLLDKNSFIIQSGRSFKNIWLDTNIISYAYGFINYSIDKNLQGIDLYSSINEQQSKVTDEQLEMCNQARIECKSFQPPKSEEEKKLEKHQAKYILQIKIVKALLILLLTMIVGGIILVAFLSNHHIVGMKFKISSTANLKEEIFINDTDTICFYAYPPSIDIEDIELINSDESKVLSFIKEVHSINGDKAIIINYKGLSLGECDIYIREKGGEARSEAVHITVKQKEEKIDNSRTVYLNYEGDKYHYSASCAGKTVFKSTLNTVKNTKKPCSKCVN